MSQTKQQNHIVAPKLPRSINEMDTKKRKEGEDCYLFRVYRYSTALTTMKNRLSLWIASLSPSVVSLSTSSVIVNNRNGYDRHQKPHSESYLYPYTPYIQPIDEQTRAMNQMKQPNFDTQVDDSEEWHFLLSKMNGGLGKNEAFRFGV